MFPGNAGQGTVAGQAMGREVRGALFTPGDTAFEACFSAVCVGKACTPTFPSHVSAALLGSCPVDFPSAVGLLTTPPVSAAQGLLHPPSLPWKVPALFP